MGADHYFLPLGLDKARPQGKMRQAAAPAASSPKKAGQGFSAHVGAKAAQAAALQALHILRRAQPAPCVSRAQVSPARPLQVASSLFYEGIGHFDGARYEEALVCFEQALAINEKCLRRRCTSRAHRLAFLPPPHTAAGAAPRAYAEGPRPLSAPPGPVPRRSPPHTPLLSDAVVLQSGCGGRRTPRLAAMTPHARGRYLLPASSGYILCCNNIAAVHERMSNPPAAEVYFGKALTALQTPPPKEERGGEARHRRAELLRHVRDAPRCAEMRRDAPRHATEIQPR